MGMGWARTVNGAVCVGVMMAGVVLVVVCCWGCAPQAVNVLFKVYPVGGLGADHVTGLVGHGYRRVVVNESSARR